MKTWKPALHRACQLWAPIPSPHVPLLPVLLISTGQTHCKMGTTSTLSSSSTGKFKSKPWFTMHQGTTLAASPWDPLGYCSTHLSSAVLTAIQLRLPQGSLSSAKAGMGAQHRQHILNESRAWKSTSAVALAVSGKRGSRPGERDTSALSDGKQRESGENNHD